MVGFSVRSLEVAALASSLIGAAITQNSSNSLPIIDLGYELHRAAEFNQTGDFYSFNNIRYAAPPVGDLRFRAPVPPAVNRSAVQDGLTTRACAQSTPPWFASTSYIPDYVRYGTLPNTTAPAANSGSNSSSATTPRDPSQGEDCLFLDVVTPRETFDQAGQGHGAPVLVWIHGGGYGSGSKNDGYDPRNLLSRSQAISPEGLVFVRLNYRLGALGFLSGSSVRADGAVNAGLLDQRMALEWVQKYIHLFGGDKNRVTLIGESAGAGSIMHQITAYGGRKPVPFQQAIIQSPAWAAYTATDVLDENEQIFLRAANASSLAEARALTSEQVMDANDVALAASPYGNFNYGPIADGSFVPRDPKQLLRSGQYALSVRMLVGHNEEEGLLFTPAITNDAQYLEFLRYNFPSAPDDVIDYLATVLYPPPQSTSTNGSAAAMLYSDQTSRAALTKSESTFVCNAREARRAATRVSGNGTAGAYAYMFNVFPSLHGQDVQYTFYNPDVPDFPNPPVISMWGTNETIALAMQDWFISFTAHSVPVTSELGGLQHFPMYGEEAALVTLSAEGAEVETDPSASERCDWWQRGLVA